MKHIGKRFAAMTAAALLLFCTGCGGSSSADGENGSSAAESSETSIPDFTIPENVLGEPSDLVPEVKVDSYALPENEGMDFVKNLGVGWNLGNTFDAIGSGITPENEMNLEKQWCGVETTIDMIASIKGAGFSSIRIPVSWKDHVDENNQISEQWMNRVKEVVDWARACDLYVIVNVHHDNDGAYFPDSEHLDESKAYLTTVWGQIAETFKDYDEHLILETLNEPRLIGTNYEWWVDPNNDQCKDAVSTINTLNQAIVDTIRATGSNNATRWIMCPGYAASVDGAMNDGFQMPDDPANHMILSVHAYTPYNFALNKTGTSEWSLDSDADKNEILNFMDKLYAKFILNGTPVVIGEFGAMNKENLEARVQFATFYTKAARVRGISCFWWDNNAFTGNGENFGLLYRSGNLFNYPEIVQGLIKGSEG